MNQTHYIPKPNVVRIIYTMKNIVFSTFFNVFHELIFAGGYIFFLSGTGGDHRRAVFTD